MVIALFKTSSKRSVFLRKLSALTSMRKNETERLINVLVRYKKCQMLFRTICNVQCQFQVVVNLIT